MSRRGPKKSAQSLARAQRMADLYRSGKTLQEIGDEYGVTRERVRQILSDQGLTRADRRRTAPYVRDVLKARAEANCLARWGISRAEYRALIAKYGPRVPNTARNPFNAYSSQRNSAKCRGIEWNLSFREWWTVWQASGKWDKRGRGYGFCMARYGDHGPYATWNVYICTGAQNASDGFLVDKPNRKRTRGFTLHKYAVKNGVRWMVHVRGAPKPYIGALPTREAAEALGTELIQRMG